TIQETRGYSDGHGGQQRMSAPDGYEWIAAETTARRGHRPARHDTNEVDDEDLDVQTVRGRTTGVDGRRGNPDRRLRGGGRGGGGCGPAVAGEAEARPSRSRWAISSSCRKTPPRRPARPRSKPPMKVRS